MTKVVLSAPIAALALLASACSPPPPKPVDQPQDDDPHPVHQAVVPSVESEIGALDATKVQAVFDRSGDALKRCYSQGVGRIGFLAGDIRLAVRVGEDGSTKHAYVKDSTLGDRTTETCMLAVLKQQTWPKPVGGKEGTADSTFSFDPGDEERPPVEWTEARMGDALKKARSALARCRSDAGAGPMKATLYVDTEGKAIGVGASGSDAKSEDAARCVVDLLMGLKYASPGSYAAKVTIAIE